RLQKPRRQGLVCAEPLCCMRSPSDGLRRCVVRNLVKVVAEIITGAAAGNSRTIWVVAPSVPSGLRRGPFFLGPEGNRLRVRTTRSRIRRRRRAVQSSSRPGRSTLETSYGAHYGLGYQQSIPTRTRLPALLDGGNLDSRGGRRVAGGADGGVSGAV